MTLNNDKKVSEFTVRLTITQDAHKPTTIGTGVLCYQKNFGDNVYIITASHCLFSDGDNFQSILSEINVDIYETHTKSYKTITVNIQETLLFKDKDNDLGIILLNKNEVLKIIGDIPTIQLTKERLNFIDFVVKGFPKATAGKELAAINPTWLQNMTGVNKFQLKLNDDYTDWATEGFSGSGIFLIANREVYLYGIFTRFRSEDKGRVIYCQFLDSLNELLDKNYLPKLQFSYLGEYGFTETFFKNHIEKSIQGLGTRYSEELNFKLPIAQRFDDVARNDYFRQRLIKIIDQWLTEDSWKRFKKNVEISNIEKKLSDLYSKVENWLLNLDFAPDKEINFQWLFDEIEILKNIIEEKIDSLYSKRREEEIKDKDIEKDHSYRPPFEDEIARLREIRIRNNNFTSNFFENINIKLTNSPLMVIKGEAGSGKSHLLGDIANKRIENNLPTVLLLGQYFNGRNTIEKHILDILDLKCTFEEFLLTCNNIAKQVSSRFLILIDAINESNNAQFWSAQLAGFINQIGKFPFIGLVLTIRDTYFEDIIPEHLRNGGNITFLTHEGFKGNEYEALRLFCDVYQLEQPKFPILAPEFTNPLFLKLLCEGISNSKEKSFPSGFQGINKIFDYYIESLNRVFQAKADYKLRKELVRTVIQKIANYYFQSNTRYLTIEKALGFFEENFSGFPSLLLDLIQEGVFTKGLIKNYNSSINEEVIYFTYERFGDFYIASELLKRYQTNIEILAACQKNNELGKLLIDYKNNGIIQAMAVILPENYQLEIFEVFEWIFKKDNRGDVEHFYMDSHFLNYSLLDSLKWRAIQSIDNKKITKWLRSKYCEINEDNWLYKLLELTTIENHPFNSDRLFKILNQYTMPKRDGFWLEHVRQFSRHNDNNQAYPIQRLIDWAWSFNISSQTTSEIARLTGQTLAWILSATDKVLRDQTTKAMVNLLEQHPKALISILDKFKNIDDMYILERLYAVAYGCTLRTEQDTSIQEIAQFTYDNIFKNGNPPTHILLRDYARNIIEYAIYKKIDIKNLNKKLITPPYKSTFPLLPTKQDIDKYHLDHESEVYKKNKYGRLYNYVHFSVVEWDFGKKVIEPVMDYFSPISFDFNRLYKDWLKRLTQKQKKIIKDTITSYINRETFINLKQKYNNPFKKPELNELFSESINEIIDYYESQINQQFSNEDKDFIQTEIIPHFILEYKLSISHAREYVLPSSSIKNWIVQRVFELGYDVKEHGHYDSLYSNFSNIEYNNNVERISKKYQWIAYYEILAFLTDHYKIRNFWRNRDKYHYYKGTWEMFLRDIDPAYITKNIQEDDENDIISSSNIKNWYAEQEYSYWNGEISNSEWVNNVNDLPNPKDFIIKHDEKDRVWVSLKKQKTWHQPKPLGKDKYNSYKQIYYSLNSYIVKKKDKVKVIKYLQNKNLWHSNIPTNDHDISRIIDREKFWAPAYLDEEKEVMWQKISGTDYKLIIATTNAKGSMEKDNSGANQNYNIPSKILFEGLKLQYAPLDGSFKDETGEIIVKATASKGLMIAQDKLFQYLEVNNLDIIWTISGEKIIKEKMNEGHRDQFHSRQPCGVFYFEKGEFKGELKTFKRI
ncbi:AVAST type 2 anti-phage system protein Avs2 [Emticicia sp. BO119]|uniref:AVAST type 2 anti-phage system protein Avs2 n=1 Tax=Emticicia sp. BO119 TaxID=2757768 RepID=UPI0015F0E0D9|nr:AVAST type 2 anti-phage system protein Avs2 [Emticicia sp. BO119]